MSYTPSRSDAALNPLVHEIATQAILESKVTDETFYVVDLREIQKQSDRWREVLPRVKPFYAVKSNNDPELLNQLLQNGLSFNCASVGEIENILPLVGNPANIIFSNPCKSPSALLFAKKHGVKKVIFDCLAEAEKIAAFFPDAEVILRISPTPATLDMTHCTTSKKFGASIKEASSLIQTCQATGLNLVGFSFHIASNLHQGDNFASALNDISSLMEEAKKAGHSPKLIDIGGGFCSEYISGSNFEKVAEVIQRTLDDLFPSKDGYEIIAEPGRFFCEDTQYLFTKVLLKKKEAEHDGEVCYKYYIGEGLYTSFNNIIMDQYKPLPFLYSREANPSAQKYKCIMFGPTCDSIDLVLKDHYFDELFVGDWLVFKKMGAYTSCAATDFNGFGTSRKIYIEN